MKEREFLEPSFDTLCVAREGVVEMAMMMMMVTLCLYVIVHIIQRCMRMSCLSTLMHLIGSAWVKMEEIRNNTHVPRPLVEGDSIRLLARVRHLQPLTPCKVTWIQSSDNKKSCGDKGHFMVQFDKATRAITPGQIVALYAGLD